MHSFRSLLAMFIALGGPIIAVLVIVALSLWIAQLLRQRHQPLTCAQCEARADTAAAHGQLAEASRPRHDALATKPFAPPR